MSDALTDHLYGEAPRDVAAPTKPPAELIEHVGGYSEAANRLLEAATELAQLASYAEIVGGISVNAEPIRKCCDEIFDLRRALPEDENFEPHFPPAAKVSGGE